MEEQTEKALADIKEIAPELFSLAVKAGRRIAYDLKHAVSSIPSNDIMKDIYEERADYFLKLFAVDSGIKDYRHSLLKQIESLEFEVKRLGRLLGKNNIDPQKWDEDAFSPPDIPF